MYRYYVYSTTTIILPLQPPRASIPIICVHTHTSGAMIDVLMLGMGRSLDLIMYVLYSGDQKFIKDMVTNVTLEVARENGVSELEDVLLHKDNHLLYKCLFFLMLDFQPNFRYWVLQESSNFGLKPICPHKANRFLKCLRDDIIPKFLVNESTKLDDFEREIKVEYIRS